MRYANYMILPELRLILECCRGKASVEDAIYMKKTEMSDNFYNPDYNIIVDFQEFETLLDSATKEMTTNFYYFLKGFEINSRVAILTSKPHQVVISMILRDLNRSSGGFNIEVFSTVKAAIRFIAIPIENFDLINNKIIELSNRTA